MAVGKLHLLHFGTSQPQATPSRGARMRHVPTVDPGLNALFLEMPKTDDHVHLSGSTRRRLIRQFLKEQGWTDAKIRKETRLKNYYKDLDDFLVTYFKVPYHIKTPDQFKRATIAIIQEAAQENVRYLEIRSSARAKNGHTPEQIIDAIESGMREGMALAKQTLGKDIKVGFIVLIERSGTPEQSMETARLAVKYAKRPGSLICGVDLGGSESHHSVLKHRAALDYVKQHGMKLTIHAGETPHSENLTGVESIKAALALGADRIGHGIQLANDPKLMSLFAKKQIPVESAPWSNVQINAISDYATHPLKLFLQKGLNVSLNTDNRMMSKINQTQQLAQLYSHGVVRCWEQMKALSLNGIKGAFISPFEKRQLLRQFAQEFTHLEKRYQDVINRFFCKDCDHVPPQRQQA